MSRLLSIVLLLCVASISTTIDAAATDGRGAPTTPDPVQKADSIFVFAGALSTRAMGSSLAFDYNWPVGPNYDNYIVGAAYNHDFYSLGYGFAIGGEVGLADRFGYFQVCCDTVIKSTSVLNSPELWGGLRFGFAGLPLFNTVRIGGALTTGFSFTANSIGVERGREIDKHGSSRVLGYLGPEISFALVDRPAWEIVYRLHHRSGANGTFGRLGEGYNANVLGLRYRF
jgi:hypothetical protein